MANFVLVLTPETPETEAIILAWDGTEKSKEAQSFVMVKNLRKREESELEQGG